MIIRFDGKIVAVTGAGHGFGREIARTFAKLWALVVATDLSADSLTETASAGGITVCMLDLRDRTAAAAWIAQIENQTGRAIDTLVNNAGGVAGQGPAHLEDVSDQNWNMIFDINVNAAFALCRATVPGMKRAGGGRIVNISSGAGLQPSLTGIQAYCSEKHALVGLTRQLAHELGGYNITVNWVAHGFMRTNVTTEAQLVERIAMKRLGSAADIANAVVFLPRMLPDLSMVKCCKSMGPVNRLGWSSR